MACRKIVRITTVALSLNIFCRGMLRELSERYEVVAISSPGADLDQVQEREGVRTIAVPMQRRISVFRDIKSLWQLIKIFRKEKPYMVHSMTPKAGLLAMVAAWITRVPIRMHTFTGLVWPTMMGPPRKILMATDKILCSCATHVVPEGEGVKNDLLCGGITVKPLRVLGYGNVRGVDMDYYRRNEDVISKAKAIRDDSKFTFIFVGRVVGNKGINELVQAFLQLKGRRPEVRLLLVGPYENDLDPIAEGTKKAIDSSESIVAVGPKFDKELLAYYAASDCFVMPSYREGFPNTVLEAGAMGLPSIVTDINGSREIIVEGENGCIIPPKDVDALFQAMINMIEHDHVRKQMADNARPMVEARFEQSFVRKCLYDFYDEIM